MEKEEFTVDELEIIEGWRVVKQHKKGYLHVVLQEEGTQFYLEVTPAKKGKVSYHPKKFC